jgi:hypothetical protein
VRPEELAYVCEEAARDLLDRHGRPLPPTVVLPAAEATRLISIPDLPDDDRSRLAALEALARAEMRPNARPAWGFVAEAELADGTDVALVAFGAHSLPPRVSAAPFLPDGGLDEFAADEALDDWALPFLSPLQRAAEGCDSPPGTPGSGD